METEVLELAIQHFPREDGTISIWDHPNFKASVKLPDDYFALTRVEQGIEMIHTHRLNEEALMVMKVVGDAMCANENQLRRYLSRKISASQTSAILSKLRKYGFVERYKCRLAFIEEDGEEAIKPPAPFTLGLAGFKLMQHLYSEQRFMNPDTWKDQPLTIQRYVAMNEVRCQAVEAGVLRQWEWNPYIGGSAKYYKPMAVARIETPQGDIQLILDRPQMAQNFVGYLKTKFEQYRHLHKRDEYIRVDGFDRPAGQVVCLYVSSLKMAKFISEEIKLHSFPYTVWLLVDEKIEPEKGMAEAFYTVSQTGLKRIRVSFLQKQTTK